MSFVHRRDGKLRYNIVMPSKSNLFAMLAAALAVLTTPAARAQQAPFPAARPPVAQPPAVRPPAASPVASPLAAPASIASPALWKVVDEDTTIYLFGTVHALPANITWYRGEVAAAFEGSHELVTEIAETDPAQMQGVVLAKAMLPPGQSLRDLLPAERKPSYEAALAKLGLPPQALDRFEPWYAAVALATLPLVRDGLASENGVEQLLEVKAKALGHPRIALETAEFQLSLFDSLPSDVQQRYLGEVIDNLSTLKQDLAEIIAAWKSGDADRLAALMNDEEDDPAMLEALLVSRNKTWADWIKTRLDKPGIVFMAVGAGHLAGPGSVQDQLKARGIAATRMQ